jgi:hypothetical protein
VRRREGGREGEVVLRVWVNTVATEGMLGDLNPLGDGPCRSLAGNGARVPKVLLAAELEGFLTGLIVAMPPKPVYGAAVQLPKSGLSKKPNRQTWPKEWAARWFRIF